MMKINIIGDFCYPNYAGGSSKHVYDLMCNFPKEGIEVTLQTRKKSADSQYSADDSEAEKEYRLWKEQGKIKEFSIFRMFNPFQYIRKIRNATHVLIEHPVMGLQGALVARLLGKKVIYHYHGPLHLEYYSKTNRKGFKYGLLWLMQKWTILFSDMIIFHSHYMQNVAIKEHRVLPGKCKLLPPYIDPKQNITVDLPCPIDRSKINILIPRRLTARTGVVEFLTMYNRLDKEFTDKFMIYITGVGELQQKVESLAGQNPLSVKYLGFVTYEQLWALYGQMDAVAVPTLDLEGFGYVILEAMACGAAAIVSITCGGGYEFVSEQLGKQYCFDVYNEQSIRNALMLIARKEKERFYYKEIADNFSTQAMIDVYINNILCKDEKNTPYSGASQIGGCTEGIS